MEWWDDDGMVINIFYTSVFSINYPEVYVYNRFINYVYCLNLYIFAK